MHLGRPWHMLQSGAEAGETDSGRARRTPGPGSSRGVKTGQEAEKFGGPEFVITPREMERVDIAERAAGRKPARRLGGRGRRKTRNTAEFNIRVASSSPVSNQSGWVKPAKVVLRSTSSRGGERCTSGPTGSVHSRDGPCEKPGVLSSSTCPLDSILSD